MAEERGQGSADLTVGPAVPGLPAGCWPLPPWPGMSLLGSYEGLRQEIQRLAQENEELRRLVQLIQENQELKQALRARGSSLGFCGAALLAEVTSSPRLPRRRTIKFKDADRGEPAGWPGHFPEAPPGFPRSVRAQTGKGGAMTRHGGQMDGRTDGHRDKERARGGGGGAFSRAGQR